MNFTYIMYIYMGFTQAVPNTHMYSCSHLILINFKGAEISYVCSYDNEHIQDPLKRPQCSNFVGHLF